MNSDERRRSAALGLCTLFWVGDDGQLRTRFKPSGAALDRRAKFLDHARPHAVRRGRPSFGSIAQMAERRSGSGRRYEFERVGRRVQQSDPWGFDSRGWANWMEVLERERRAPPEEGRTMRVRELIEKLQAFDPEREVVISYGHLLPDLAVVREISNTDDPDGDRVVALIPDPDDVAGADVVEIAADDDEGDVE